MNGSRTFDYGDGFAGYYEKKIILRDTVKDIKVWLFYADKRLYDRTETKGDLSVIALKKPETLLAAKADSLAKSFHYFQNDSRDSIFFWSKTDKDTIRYTLSFPDTIISLKEKANNTKDTVYLETGSMGTISPLADLGYKANHPLKDVNLAKIKVLQDSLTEIENNKIKAQIEFRSLSLSFPKKENKDYFIIFQDSAFTDIFGNYNKHQIQKLRTGSENEFGNLILKLDNEGKASLIVELFDNNGRMVGRQFLAGERKTIKFSNLSKGSYKAIGIIDENKNGFWDNGNFEKRIQPEQKILLKENIEIKGGWDVDAEIKL